MERQENRNHALEAVRAVMFPLGLVVASAESFLPGFASLGWPIVDNSPSWGAAGIYYVLHIFRLTTFFLLSGFFAHLVFHRRGTAAYIKQRSKRILIPLVVGWCVFVPLIVLTFAWAIHRGAHGGASPQAAPANRTGVFNLTHLWFLYYLAWLNLIVLSVRAIVVRLDSSGIARRQVDRILHAVVNGYLAPLVFALPTAIALNSLHGWWLWMGIPSPNTSLIPQIPSLVAYGTAFSIGWLLHRQVDLINVWQRRWPVHLPIACLLTLLDLYIMRRIGVTSAFATAPGGAVTAVYALVYGLAIWYWTFALIGLALRFLSHESHLRRYFADSSYWVYFAHLPLVFALQVALMRSPWNWALKLVIIVVVSYSILILMYHYCVRSTFIGVMLNGRRYPRIPFSAVFFAAAKQPMPEDVHTPKAVHVS
jgi:glucan biosynthesis protein C